MQIEDITAGEHYVIYTDGSCSGNPGPGGWGAVLYRMNGASLLKGPVEMSAGTAQTTNNEMEMTAAIRGLRALGANGLPVLIFTDSKYLIGGMTEWLPGWRVKGWRKSDGTPVRNVDFWEALLAALGDRRAHWEWVKGHSGHEGNERANLLAQKAMQEAKRKAGRGH